MSTSATPVTTTAVYARATLSSDQNIYTIFYGSMSVSTASVIVALLHIFALSMIFICQLIALKNGHIGSFLTFLTFVSFVLLIWSIVSLIGLFAAFFNYEPRWLYPLLYLVVFCIFYFLAIAGLTVAAMAVEGPSMEFMRAMYSNTAHYSDPLVERYPSFKAFVREVTSLKLIIFLIVHLFAMLFDCAAFGVVSHCVEYLEMKKPRNGQSQPQHAEPNMRRADQSQTSQYTSLPPTVKPPIVSHDEDSDQSYV